MTVKEINKLVKSAKVKYIRLQFCDMLGTLKSVEIPSVRLLDALNQKIMFDGSSIEGCVRIKESDMYLDPDLNTFLVLPIESSNNAVVARIICDVIYPDGTPFLGDPRTILKIQLKRLSDLGYSQLNIGVEPEFYLFKMKKGLPVLEYSDKGSYFDLAPEGISENCRRDIAIALEKVGFTIETSHHEVGPGQNEINFRFSNALDACDNLQTFKLIVKQVAKKHHLYASFMPKPVMGEAGNGMHVNCSLADVNNKNAFYDETTSNQLSEVARKWINGIIHHASELSLLTNPIINSYKRLVTGYEAPCYISWSDANRSSMIRIPQARGEQTRTEIRNVDCAANPYLAIAGIISAGIEGLTNQVPNYPPANSDLFAMNDTERAKLNIRNLPTNLGEALASYSKSKLLKETLGDYLYNKYQEAKKKEWDEYQKQVHNWEIIKYL